MEKQHVKTAKLASRIEFYAKPVKSRSIVDGNKSRNGIGYGDTESDESN
jgi:hypothetical protein